MKIAELSSGRTSPTLSRQPPPYCQKQKRRYRIRGYNSNIKNIYCGRKRINKESAMMEDPQTPGSDCNSNPADPISQDLIGSEFIQDNSDYQWFIDYGYRDGSLHVHPSVLTSLSTSYNHDDFTYYDDLSRNLDANLAEVDMESFKTADIHTLLTALPVMCTDPVQQSEFNYQRERYASITGSVMEKIDIGTSLGPQNSSQGEDSASSTTDTISICKSSLLFSPVKETPVLPPGGSYSVDSLDCEDMLLTCQTNNKNNYTIAFEGSMTMYSDGSQDFESQEKLKNHESRENSYYNQKMDIKNILDLSMICSDSKIYTTWSNLKNSSSSNNQMTRNDSVNNNNNNNNNNINNNITSNFYYKKSCKKLTKKFKSLPNLYKPDNNIIDNTKYTLNYSTTNLIESSNNQESSTNSGNCHSITNSSNSNTSNDNKKLQNISLVKLYMKQKSMSSEGMSLTLDQTDSTSDNNWPISNNNSHHKNIKLKRQQINDNNNKKNIPNNDYSINWIKNDDYNKNDDNNTNKITSIKENKEETTSSIDKIDINIIDDYKKDNNNDNNKLIDNNTPILRSTGTQAITKMQENSVQTSLLYVLPPKNDYSYIRETLIDKKPVYIVYPNYTLPDLSFLNTTKICSNNNNVTLKPQCRTTWKKQYGRNNRPFSCNDIDAVKQKGFSHIKDWESLTFLLPLEYRKVLHDVPEIPKNISLNEEIKKPLFCLSPPMMRNRSRKLSDAMTATNVSSSSSTGTQPSSGYRGSSTILTDSSTNQQTNQNPLYLYRYDSASSDNSITSQDKKLINGKLLTKRSLSLIQNNDTPPRPPLPRSILRKNRISTNKRYSMFDMGGGIEEIDDHYHERESNKRMSLQEPYFINNNVNNNITNNNNNTQLHTRHGKIIDSDKDVDEVEERRYAERMKEVDAYCNKNLNNNINNNDDIESSIDDVKQLEEYLKKSGFSSNNSSDESACGINDDNDIKLRSYVKKFLSLKMNKDLKYIDMQESQKKQVSFAKLNSNNNIFNVNDDIDDDKKMLMYPINKSVDLLIKYWQSGSRDTYDKNECSQICLTNLCSSLYAIMSDGLKQQLTTSFGPITNSVWQVIEISSQQGPLTNNLNDLVQKINSEDFMTEGMIKFNAFIFGLLNLRSLDAWFAYLFTRETILRKHYSSTSLFVSSLGCVKSRLIIDKFLNVLQPLAFCPFQLDLFYQYRQLHNSFGNINGAVAVAGAVGGGVGGCIISPSPKKTRPRSCNYDDKITKNDNDIKKRWSNLTIGNKINPVLDKFCLDDSEDYTDSLEHSPLKRGGNNVNKNQRTNSPDKIKSSVDDDMINGEIKFRKLQEKWELMVCNDDVKDTIPTSPNKQTQACPIGTSQKSKIPRLLTSPIKQQQLKTKLTTPSTSSSLKKPTPTSKLVPKKSTDVKIKELPKRTSRVDQEHTVTTRNHLTRPSSLPYKTYGPTSKDKNLISPTQRRAASTSIPRTNNTPTSSRTSTATTPSSSTSHIKKPLKEVKTLTQRLPSDNGHLSFNEGDRLKVIFEVDNKWLLCAKGERKGLVPRTCVHPYQT
ncbi:hypothetical protein HCN44_003943 [Aphidius gifuensis]|uniref:Iporin n=3 Tax=Aphidius gifuensis TaxID=684658 RepID=A0A834Y0T1_APHGI|nr:hypothetical protein HCN44_003943 [Aphidius gifuensis]